MYNVMSLCIKVSGNDKETTDSVYVYYFIELFSYLFMNFLVSNNSPRNWLTSVSGISPHGSIFTLSWYPSIEFWIPDVESSVS
jgi:hypothetical protein